MKYIKLLFLGSLFTTNFHAMHNNRELLVMLQEHQKALKRDLIALAVLASGVATSEGLKYMNQCGTQCPLSYYLPLVPGAILVTRNLIITYLPSGK